MTLTFARAALKPTDICAYIGACLGVTADSVSSLTVAVCNGYGIRSVERRAVTLGLISEVVDKVVVQDMTIEVAATYIHLGLADNAYMQAVTDSEVVTLGRNK